MLPGIFIFVFMKKQLNLRSLAAQAVEQVLEQGQSLSNVLPSLQQKVSDKDKALLQELCFGVLRTLSQLDWLINKLMSRPMTGKQRIVHYLIMVGFNCSIRVSRRMPHWRKRLKAQSLLNVHSLKG